MGERIKVVNRIDIGNSFLDIEVNSAVSRYEEKLIHLQNTHFRIELSLSDFLIASAAILESERQFKWIKEKRHE